MQTPAPRQPLYIEFQQRGGMVGGRWSTAVNTAELPPDEARELEELVEQADFFRQPRGLFRLSSPLAVDYFEYEIKVVQGQRRRRVRTDDVSMPATLRPLVSRLQGYLRAPPSHIADA